MKYKEFIQAVDSLTNEALVANKEATPWKVDIDDQDVLELIQRFFWLLSVLCLTLFIPPLFQY